MMLPMMAAVPLGLGEVCRRERSSIWWWALVCTGVISCVLTIPLVLTDPQMHQIEDTARLMNVSLTSALRVPQFEYLRMYYVGEWFRGAGSRDYLLRSCRLWRSLSQRRFWFESQAACPGIQKT